MFGPLFGKELLEMARRRRYFVVRVLIGFGLLVGWWVALGGESPTVAYKNIATLSVIGERLFREWTYWSLWGVVLVTPMLVCGLIAAEKDGRTFDTLLTTLLTNREILVGKAVSRLLLVLILLGSSVPILAVASLYGGFDVMQVAVSATIIAATALFIVVVGMYYSAITFKPYIALLRTYFFLAVLWWMLPSISSSLELKYAPVSSPWSMLNRSLYSIGDERVAWARVKGFRNRQPQAALLNFMGVPAGMSDHWVTIGGPLVVHLLIAFILYRRTDRLLRQRLVPGKPPWIFRAATAAYRGLISGARSSVESSRDPLSKAIWAGEKVTERWHQARLDRIVDKNPLVYRNRVANAFDPERFVAAIQIIVGAVGLLLLLSISFFGDAGSLSSRLFERIGIWSLVGSAVLFLFCSAILAACSFARERQYGSWEVLMLADLSPWLHLSAALRGVVGSLRLLAIIVAALAVIVGYVWGGFYSTLVWAAAMASIWLLIVSHALFASLCHRTIAGALSGSLFGLALILLAPRAMLALMPAYVMPVLLLSAVVVVFAATAGWRGRQAAWTQLSVAMSTMIVVATVTWFLGSAARLFNQWQEPAMYFFMKDFYTRHGMAMASPLEVVFGPMEWGRSEAYIADQTARQLESAPAYLVGALFNIAMFLALFRRLSRAEPGDFVPKSKKVILKPASSPSPSAPSR
jgi:hypothetical protein